ncbi:MAG: CPBP family intramembrane metalloprotease [Clostridia bacterium]|nr:CPBP family intramembrane metalloprotease [Clostridia bacterium]MBQ8398389.1 CPBP family intramembrane metalloprotease [Clostridia bacterium]
MTKIRSVLRSAFHKESFTAPLLVLFVIALTFLSKKAPDLLQFSSREDLFLTYTVLELLIFVLPGVLYTKMKPRGYCADMNLISFGFSQLPQIILMFLVMVFGGVLMGLAYDHFGIAINTAGTLRQDAQMLFESGLSGNAKELVYLCLALAVVPAFAEEFLFRGVLLREYRPYGMLCAVSVTSFFFAILHFDILLFPFYFLAGMALGFTAYCTRSAFASGVVHALYNLFSFFVLPIINNFLSLESGRIAVFYSVVVLFLLFLMLAFGEAERLFSGYSTAGLPRMRLQKKKFAALPACFDVLTIPFLLCVLLFVLGSLQIIPLPL